MAKSKKLFLVMLFTLLVSDICKYINAFKLFKLKGLVSFDLLITHSQNGFVINKAMIFLLTVSLLYFLVNFFRNDNE